MVGPSFISVAQVNTVRRVCVQLVFVLRVRSDVMVQAFKLVIVHVAHGLPPKLALPVNTALTVHAKLVPVQQEQDDALPTIQFRPVMRSVLDGHITSLVSLRNIVRMVTVEPVVVRQDPSVVAVRTSRRVIRIVVRGKSYNLVPRTNTARAVPVELVLVLQEQDVVTTVW